MVYGSGTAAAENASKFVMTSVGAKPESRTYSGPVMGVSPTTPKNCTLAGEVLVTV
jgi:hypothetical protein